MVLSLSAEQFRCWKARGRATSVRRIEPDRFVLDLAITGEGFEWTERRMFALPESGRKLVADDLVSAMKLRERRCVRCEPTP